MPSRFGGESGQPRPLEHGEQPQFGSGDGRPPARGARSVTPRCRSSGTALRV